MASTTEERVQIDPGELVNSVVDEHAGLAVRRLFTIAGRDPFDEIEWETRDAHIPGRNGPAFEQRGVEFPKFWSQTATNIVAQKYFRGRMASPEREKSVKQMIGRVVGTIGAWGRDGSYFATEEEAQTFEDELKAILVNQLAAFNSPVWFNVGFEEKPQCSACFILSIEDSMDSILDWIRREGVIFRGGSGSGVNLSRLRSSKEQLSKGGYASGPVSFMRGADASAGTIKSGGKTRRAAKMVVLDVDHPDILEFVWCKAHEEEKARVLEAAGYDMSLDSADWASIQYQNANNSVRVSDAFMQAVEADEDWNLTARTDGSVVETIEGAEALARHLRGSVALCRSWRAVRHDDQQLAHAAEHGPHQRVEPVLRVHVDRQLGVQPRLAEPDEVPPRRRRARRRGVPARLRRRLPGTGDPRRQLVLPDARDRGEREGLPSARPGLREPRRAADGARPRVRLRRGSRLCSRDHRAHDRPRLPQVGGDRRPDGRVRRLPAERGRHDRRHLQAPRRGRQHRARRDGPGRPARRRAPSLGRRARPRRGQRLPQRAGDRARADRDDQLHDGLRHDGRGARLLARQVEEARRRRRDHHRQQDRCSRPREARLRTDPRSTRSSRSSTSATPSSARRTSRASTSRCSTAPSASARSTIAAT